MERQVHSAEKLGHRTQKYLCYRSKIRKKAESYCHFTTTNYDYKIIRFWGGASLGIPSQLEETTLLRLLKARFQVLKESGLEGRLLASHWAFFKNAAFLLAVLQTKSGLQVPVKAFRNASMAENPAAKSCFS